MFVLAAAGWDGTVAAWTVTPGAGLVKPLAATQHLGPALCCVMAPSGTLLLSGGCDGNSMHYCSGLQF